MLENALSIPQTPVDSAASGSYVDTAVDESVKIVEHVIAQWQLKEYHLDKFHEFKLRVESDAQLSKLLPSCDRNRNPDTWLRFLAARDWDVTTAFDMFFEQVVWRHKFGVNFLVRWTLPPVFESRATGVLLDHLDKKGNCVYYERLGTHDISGFFEAIGTKVYQRMVVAHRERVIEQMKLKYMQHGVCGTNKRLTVIFDLAGLQWSQCSKSNLRRFGEIMAFDQLNYPDFSHVGIFVNTPTVFMWLWTVLQRLLDKGTREKFLFATQKNQYELLSKYLDPEAIPYSLGGTNTKPLPQGGRVSKNEVSDMEECGYIERLCVSRLSCSVLPEIHLQQGDALFWDFWGEENVDVDCTFLTDHVITEPVSVRKNSSDVFVAVNEPFTVVLSVSLAAPSKSGLLSNSFRSTRSSSSGSSSKVKINCQVQVVKGTS